MDEVSYGNILKRLQSQELILPILENQMRADAWPESYQITVDSSPYYGRGDGYFHPSSHPLLHPRQLYYMFHPDTRNLMEEEPFSIQREMTLATGSSLHAVVQTQMTMSGLTTPEDIEVDFLNAAHHVRGRTDMVVHHPTEGPIVVELKTRTAYKFDSTTIEDMPNWEIQTSLACDNLGERYNTDFTYAIVIMMETGYPFRMRELRVPRNDEKLRETYAKFDFVRESIAANIPPPFCCAVDSKEMKSCRARHVCWLKEKRGA
jgi:hypothetical protein